MSDPLAGYFEKAAPSPQTGDPLAGYFGSATATEEGPSDFGTATGREQARITNLESNIEKLRKIKPANEAHKVRIDKLIESYQRQLPSGYGFIEGTSEPDRSKFENIVRGASAGAINEGLMGAASLVTGLMAPAGKGPLAPLAERIGEARQEVKEEFDPQGVAGSAAEIGGGLLGGTVAYGGAADVAATQIGKVIPAVGRVVEAAHAGGGAGTRIAANLAGGVPLNLAMAIGQPVSGDTSHDLAARVKQFGIGTVADILFGFLPAGRRKAAPESKVTAEGPKQQLSADRTQAFVDTQVKRQAREAAAAYDRDARTQSRAEWQVANQGKKWTDVPKEDRTKIINQWKEAHPKPAPKAEVTPEQQAAIEAGPTPVNPAEIEATVTQVKQALEAKGATDVDPVQVMEDLRKTADRRTAARPEDAVIWTAEERARFITDRQKAYAAKINKPWSQWTASERAGYVADQMAIRKELADKRALAPESPSGVPEDTSGENPSAILSSFGQGKAGYATETKDGFDFVVFRDEAGQPQGALQLDAATPEGRPVLDVFVRPESRRKGIATGLYDFVENQGTKLLHVSPRTPEGEAFIASREARQAPILPEDDFDTIVADVQARGGLTDPEDLAAFNQELINLHERDLSPEAFHAEVEALKEDFTPISQPARDATADVQGSAVVQPARGGAEPNVSSAEATGVRPAADGQAAFGATVEATTTPVAAPETQTPVLPEARRSTPLKTQNATTTSGTMLETVEHTKPLEQLSARKLEGMTDRLLKEIEDADAGTPEYEAMHRDLEKLMAAERASEAPSEAVRAAEAPLPEGAVVRPELSDANITGAARVTRVVEEAPAGLDPKVARKLFSANLKRMADEDLNAHIDDMQGRVSVLGKDEGAPYRERLDKALEERAERFQSSAGVRLQIPPAAGGFTAGFIGGFLSSDDDSDRLTNALMWGAVGAGVGHVAGRVARPILDKPIVTPRSVEELPGGAWQNEIHEHVVTDYQRGKAPNSFREKMRHIYTGMVRRTFAAERFIQSVGASRLGAEKNAAKQLAMYGRWTGQTESALKYGPALFDEFGNYKKLDALGVDDILAMVEGDVESLGDLMVARTKVEMGDAIKTPFNTVAAEKMFFSVPEKFHKAADEMRKFSLAMAEVLVDGGVLSRDALSKFKAETMYATLQRVFKMDSGQMTSAEKGSGNVVRASSPVKARKGGSETDIKNPVEATIASVPWYYRSAEQNKIKHGLVEAWEAAGSPTWLMRRISKSEVKVTADHEAKIALLKSEIKGLTDENAHALVAGLDPRAIDPLEGTMRVFRNGVVESYKMPKELAVALQTMNAEDIGTLAKVLGMPARLASKGITLNPFFLAKMSFFDAWQATLNSQYGFRWGVDNIRGWLNIVGQSKKYQEYLGVGGSHQSFAGSKEAFSTKLESVKTNVGSPLEVAVKQLKQLKPIEAYKTLVTPLGDAARIGEYLRALDHGSSTIEAVFAAKQVTANYSEVGAFAEMRAIQHMTMFLGPALQVLDQSLYRAGVHPFRVSEEGRLADITRYGTKAFFSVSLPTMLLWAKYHDDEEITQLRQTQAGRRFWFMRSPVSVPGVVDKGEIVRIPKPILDGQVWGTSMEAALDNLKGQDPQSARMIAKGILRDAAFNILPTIGVIPYSLAANQDLTWGGNIIPLADDQLALEHQGEDRASWISREVSKGVAPLAQGLDSPMVRNALTPAGLDYIIRSVGGLLGQDGVLAVSQAMEAQAKGYVPAKEELPLIKQVVVDYPNTRVRDIEMFYDRLKDVQTVGATIDHLAKEDPEKLVSYMEHNQADYMLVRGFNSARQTIANYRRAIGDIKKMDSSEISSEDRRQVIKTYIELMQQSASTAMMQAKEVDDALKPADKRRVVRPLKTLRDTTESITGRPLAIFDSGGPLSTMYLKAAGAEGAYNPLLDFIAENPKTQGIFPSNLEPPQHVDVHEHAHHLWNSSEKIKQGFLRAVEGRAVDPNQYAASGIREQFAEAFARAMGVVRHVNAIHNDFGPKGPDEQVIADWKSQIALGDKEIPGTKYLVDYILSQPVYKGTYAASVIH